MGSFYLTTIHWFLFVNLFLYLFCCPMPLLVLHKKIILAFIIIIVVTGGTARLPQNKYGRQISLSIQSSLSALRLFQFWLFLTQINISPVASLSWTSSSIYEWLSSLPYVLSKSVFLLFSLFLLLSAASLIIDINSSVFSLFFLSSVFSAQTRWPPRIGPSSEVTSHNATLSHSVDIP